MRTPALLSFLLSAGLASPTDAAEQSIQVFSSAPTTSGSASGGVTRSYTFTATVSGSAAFRLDGNNLTCGYDLQKSSKLGFLPRMERFPLRLVDRAVAGEIYTLSFFQSRLARTNEETCTFSFAIE